MRFASIVALIGSLLLASGTSLADTITRLGPALEKQHAIKPLNPKAETLYSITQSALEESGHWQRKTYISIRINDQAAARDYGRISIPFNHYYSELSLDFANTMSNKGKVTPVSEDALQQRITGGGQDFYSDSSELVFSLPDISVGSIIEFQFTRKSNILPLKGLFTTRVTPYWFQPTVSGDGWRADFVHHFDYSLETPSNITIHTKAFTGFKEKAKISQSTDTTKYVWKMKHNEGIQSEGWMPLTRHLLPIMQLSTMNKWKYIDAWSWEKIQNKLGASPALKTIIQSFKLSPDATNEEKVKAVYAYLQGNIRYVFAHLSRGGYEPHSPEDVIAVNYGDCKDQAVLAVALLRQLGIEAYPGLVETPRAGDSDTATVGLIFDHMIVHIPANQDIHFQWMDTTGDNSRYPGMSHYLAGQNALVVNGVGGKLTKIPDLGENTATLLIDFHENKGGSARAQISIEYDGFFEQNIRSWWIHSTDKENALRQYLDSLYSSNKNYTAGILHAEDLWQNIGIQAQFNFEKREEPMSSYGGTITQALRMFSGLGSLPIPESRRSNFLDNYPYRIKTQLRFHTPPNTEPALVQSTDAHQTDFFNLSYQTETTEDYFQIDMEFSKPKLNLHKSQYKHYYDAVQSINKEDIWVVKMLPKQNNTLTANVKQGIKPNSVEYYVNLAKAHIEQGEFDQALTPAQQAVDLKPGSGEAWYVLGMVQGFNSLIEESSHSFSKAEDLGHIP